jgi:Putative Flp pilus-assembly TadE/G-like
MKIRNEQGQSMVLAVVFLTVLMAMSAFVLDVGAWYRAHRAAQTTADASALAAAQGLTNTTEATTLANSYASKNGGGLNSITFSSKWMPNDTVAVKVTRSAPGIFARLFGLGSVNVSGRATARAYKVAAVRHVAPIVVHYKHPLLHCTRSANPTCNPEHGVTTTLNLEDLHQPGGGDGSGAFGLINLNKLDDNGNIGAGTLADWLTNGFDDEMPLGHYHSAPSANFNNSQFLGALDSVIGEEVLFPVYRKLTGPGSNAQYDIIGWIGFIIRSYSTNGSKGTLTGEFTRYIAEGLPVENSGGPPDTGVHEIELVN